MVQLFKSLGLSTELYEKRLTGQQADLIFRLIVRPWLLEGLSEHIEMQNNSKEFADAVVLVFECLFNFCELKSHPFLNVEQVERFLRSKSHTVKIYYLAFLQVEMPTGVGYEDMVFPE